mmetsp:Transcript_103510/g.322462  ORF Transcript_103510/g.322462 Transcript_103510/m.322462 type:complete len:472 (-) Transcript_103510:6-1421(-)
MRRLLCDGHGPHHGRHTAGAGPRALPARRRRRGPTGHFGEASLEEPHSVIAGLPVSKSCANRLRRLVVEVHGRHRFSRRVYGVPSLRQGEAAATHPHRLALVAARERADEVRCKSRNCSNLRLQQQHQVPIQLQLHALCVDVVGIGSKRVLYFRRNRVQRPIDEDSDEAEEGAPPWFGDPLRDDERGDHPMNQQQALTGLCIGEREGDRGYLDRLVKSNHAVGNLLERSREDGRRNVHDTRLDVLHDQLLDPLEDKLHLRIGVPQCLEALGVQARRVHELVLEGRDLVVVDAARVLNVRQRHGVKHAEEPDERVLELQDLLLPHLAVLAEGDQGTASVEPLGPHLVGRGAPVPEAGVGLRSTKYNEEAHQKDKTAPARVVLQQCLWVLRISDGDITTLDAIPQGGREDCAGHSNHQGEGEDAALDLEYLDKAKNSSFVRDHRLEQFGSFDGSWRVTLTRVTGGRPPLLEAA